MRKQTCLLATLICALLSLWAVAQSVTTGTLPATSITGSLPVTGSIPATGIPPRSNLAWPEPPAPRIVSADLADGKFVIVKRREYQPIAVPAVGCISWEGKECSFDYTVREVWKEVYGVKDGKLALLETIKGTVVPAQRIEEKIEWPTETASDVADKTMRELMAAQEYLSKVKGHPHDAALTGICLGCGSGSGAALTGVTTIYADGSSRTKLLQAEPTTPPKAKPPHKRKQKTGGTTK